MPTHHETEHFWRDYDALTETQKRAFERVVAGFPRQHPLSAYLIRRPSKPSRLPVSLGQIHGLPRQRRRDGRDTVPLAPVPPKGRPAGLALSVSARRPPQRPWSGREP